MGRHSAEPGDVAIDTSTAWYAGLELPPGDELPGDVPDEFGGYGQPDVDLDGWLEALRPAKAT